MSDVTLEQALAQQRSAAPDIVDVDEPTAKFIVFALGTACFALHGERVREILANAEVFFIPGSPPSLEGVINVRGDIESVIRLDGLLQQSMRPEGGVILLGRGTAIHSGIRVDRVIDVLDLPHSIIQSPPATLPEHLRPLVLGIFDFQGLPVTLLDLDSLFAEYARGAE